MADVLGKAVQQTVHGGVGALLAADVQHDVATVSYTHLFSADRSIMDYARDIWGATPVK